MQKIYRMATKSLCTRTKDNSLSSLLPVYIQQHTILRRIALSIVITIVIPTLWHFVLQHTYHLVWKKLHQRLFINHTSTWIRMIGDFSPACEQWQPPHRVISLPGGTQMLWNCVDIAMRTAAGQAVVFCKCSQCCWVNSLVKFKRNCTLGLS